jgi:hypothetical protein
VDSEGMFEIARRYKEFNLLRTVLVERFPGLYVPPIPHKKSVVIINLGKIVFRVIWKLTLLKKDAIC